MPKLVHRGFIRAFIAHFVAARIVIGYLLLMRFRKLLGEERYARRMGRAHMRHAKRVRKTIVRLGGLFIKVGQMLSSMGQLLPEEYGLHLEELQDKAPQTAFPKISARIQAELGDIPQRLFLQFDTDPVASASIAQVHKAQLQSGEWVAVKVKHPRIDAIAKTDLAIMRRLMTIAAWFLRIEGMDFMYTQVREMIDGELNFEQERSAQTRLRHLMQRKRGLVIPMVHGAYSSVSVLTTSWFTGVKINNTSQLTSWNLNPTDLAKRVIRIYCEMLFEHGYYHADPHPGNLLVNERGIIALIDFGAVGTISAELRQNIPLIIEAALVDDIPLVVSKAQEIGFLAPGEQARNTGEQIVEALRTFMIDELKMTDLNLQTLDIDIDPFNNSMVRLIKDIGMRRMMRTFRIPKDWALLNRAASLILGLCATLDPKLNPLVIMRPYLRRRLLRSDKRQFVRIVSAVIRQRVSDSAIVRTLVHHSRAAAAAVASGMVAFARLLIG
jgi:ubiquinone biosynthesis protein